MSIFQYTQVKLPDNCKFKISPSSIGKFFDYPSVWYREQVLGEDGFQGNTASVLGTCVHYIAEQYALDNPISRETINGELDQIDNPDVDIQAVKDAYPDLAMELVNNYVSDNKPSQVELQLVQPVKDDIYLGGSCDAYDEASATVVDYKTTARKPSETIPFGYKIQALAYAWMLKQQGKPVDRIRIVWAVRPTKTIGVRIIPVTQMITPDDWKLIEDTLTMIADTITTAKKQPELIPLLFKSMSLKDS